MIAGVTLAAASGIVLLYRPLLFSTFDEETAEVFGVPTHWVNTLFALILAAVIIVSMQVMGVTLIAASLIIPASAARLLTDRFARLLGLARPSGRRSGCWGCSPVTTSTWPPAPPSSWSARGCSPSPGFSVPVRGKCLRFAHHRRPDDHRGSTPAADHPLPVVVQQLAVTGLDG